MGRDGDLRRWRRNVIRLQRQLVVAHMVGLLFLLVGLAVMMLL